MARQSAIPVLITRPEPQATRFAEELETRLGPSVRALRTPLMAEVFLTPDLPPGEFAAVILSSETAVRAAARLRRAGRALPVRAWCVGDRTAAVAREEGFDAASASGAAEELAALILSQPDEGPLLWLRGRDRTGDLLSLLAGRRVAEAVVYAQTERPFTAEALAVLAAGGAVVIPLFSPRSARLFVQSLPKTASARLLPVVISAKVAAALPDGLAARAVIAEHPDAPAMIAAVSRAVKLGVP